jgi:alpha-beta hydrolase superfamily lysophospholipase
MTIAETEDRDVEIRSAGGLLLRARLWAQPDPRGIVAVAHGFGEHGGNYEHVAQAIGPAAGVDFIALDFRGHGRSPGKRGVVDDYEDLVSDLISTLEWASNARPGLPRFVLGHSNGGQVALRAALDPQTKWMIDGLIVSNPSLRLVEKVPAYKLRLGRFLLRHAPHVTLRAPLEAGRLTRDLELQRKRQNDPLCHCRMSAPLFFGMVEGGAMLIERAKELDLPVLMILSDADPIIDPISSRAAFEKFSSTDKSLKIFPGMLHEPLNELGREQVFAAITSWLNAHLSPATGL